MASQTSAGTHVQITSIKRWTAQAATVHNLTTTNLHTYSAGVEAPLDLAQHLVRGAVAFARGLGFEPYEEFAAAAVYLGEPARPVPIEFGRDGVPFYVAGPYDDVQSIVRSLNAAVGEGNYHYVLPMG